MSDCASPDLAKIHVLIENLPMLCNSLPSSVPEANPWHTFNCPFDILFGEDCWDDKGRLHHLRQGPLGMGAVCTYLNSLNLDDMCYVLAIPGTISPVEQLFSKSQHLCTDQQSSLAAATVTQSMCAKLWIQQGLFDFNK
ncbi:hypothetical protein F4604DRAFT_1936352 [Suillus subluteus]|nr:hypothetical protein F4604DRAFT_1936352 [Suillus subluteus]